MPEDDDKRTDAPKPGYINVLKEKRPDYVKHASEQILDALKSGNRQHLKAVWQTYTKEQQRMIIRAWLPVLLGLNLPGVKALFCEECMKDHDDHKQLFDNASVEFFQNLDPETGESYQDQMEWAWVRVSDDARGQIKDSAPEEINQCIVQFDVGAPDSKLSL